MMMIMIAMAVMTLNEKKNEDNINLIVHAVLEELKSKYKNQYSEEKNQNSAIEYAKEIDNYIRSDHTKRNDDFRHKLQKLTKSICKADVRDHTLPNFTKTEYNLMKAF